MDVATMLFHGPAVECASDAGARAAALATALMT